MAAFLFAYNLLYNLLFYILGKSKKNYTYVLYMLIKILNLGAVNLII
jgi:hypothetical protein